MSNLLNHAKLVSIFFYSQDEVLQHIIVPLTPISIPLSSPSNTFGKLTLSILECAAAYKQSKRREDDISIVTAAFRVRLEELPVPLPSPIPRYRVVDVALSFGGCAATTRRAGKTEKALLGAEFGREKFEMAYKLLAEVKHES